MYTPEEEEECECPSYHKDLKEDDANSYERLGNDPQPMNALYPEAEIKFFDSGFDGNFVGTGTVFSAIPSNTGSVACINQMQNDPSTSSYVGNQINSLGLEYRFFANINTTGTIVPCNGRVVFFWDRQPNATTPVWNDYFAIPHILSYINLSNRDRITILKDIYFSLSPNGDQALLFHGYIPIDMKTTYLIEDAGQFAVPNSGAIFVGYIADTSATFDLVGVFRFTFTDA